MFNSEYYLKKGIIYSHDDPDEKGGIVVRILPDMEKVASSKLPVAFPFISFNSENETSNDMPEINSIIYILVDKYFKRFYYLGNKRFSGLFNFLNITDKLNEASEITGNNYSDLKFRMYADGFLEFHNKVTGEHGTIHSSGSYNIYDSAGNIFINGVGNKLKIYNTSNTLKEILTDIRDVLENVITPLAWKDGDGNPCSYSSVGTDLPKIQSVVTKLNNLLKD